MNGYNKIANVSNEETLFLKRAISQINPL